MHFTVRFTLAKLTHDKTSWSPKQLHKVFSSYVTKRDGPCGLARAVFRLDFDVADIESEYRRMQRRYAAMVLSHAYTRQGIGCKTDVVIRVYVDDHDVPSLKSWSTASESDTQ